jgi:hypothetical protein
MISKEIFTVEGNKWKLEGYENCKFYRFAIRAKNVCGFSSFSPVKVVDTKIPPGKMEIIGTEQSSCSAKMSWKVPYNCGSPIERYHIEVKTRDGKFRGLPSCGEQPTDVSCEVNMQLLQAAPFNLLYGDSIIARGAAKNAVGRGDMSETLDQGTLILQRPDKMNSPVLEDTTERQIAVSWDKVKPVDAGDLEVVSYSLFWNDMSDTTQSNLITSMSSEFTAAKLEKLSLYRFTISAKDECGKTDAEDAPLESLHVG